MAGPGGIQLVGGWIYLVRHFTFFSNHGTIFLCFFRRYEQVYKFREYGYSVDYFVDFSVTTDLKNSSWRILDLDQPGLGMSREYLIKGLQDEDVQVRQNQQWYKAFSFSEYLLACTLLHGN